MFLLKNIPKMINLSIHEEIFKFFFEKLQNFYSKKLPQKKINKI